MTQTNETNSRIARLEALMLEIAASNLRHDRNIDTHSEAIDLVRQRQIEHEEWQRQNESAMQRHQERMERIETIIESNAAQQQRHQERMERIETIIESNAAQQQRHQERMERIETIIESNAAQQRQNIQDIAELKASITDLRNLVANYIQSRSGL